MPFRVRDRTAWVLSSEEEGPYLILNFSHILRHEEIRKELHILLSSKLLQGNGANFMGTIIARFFS
jgi:hypothetical protein